MLLTFVVEAKILEPLPVDGEYPAGHDGRLLGAPWDRFVVVSSLVPLEVHVPAEGAVQVGRDGVVVESRVVDGVNYGARDRLMEKDRKKRKMPLQYVRPSIALIAQIWLGQSR